MSYVALDRYAINFICMELKDRIKQVDTACDLTSHELYQNLKTFDFLHVDHIHEIINTLLDN